MKKTKKGLSYFLFQKREREKETLLGVIVIVLQTVSNGVILSKIVINLPYKKYYQKILLFSKIFKF